MVNDLYEVPEKWFLPDAVNWLAFNILPFQVFSQNKVNIRSSFEQLGINLFDIEELVSPACFSPEQTNYLGLAKDPRWIQSNEQRLGGEYLRSPEHYERSVQIIFDDTESSQNVPKPSRIQTLIVKNNTYSTTDRHNLAKHKLKLIKRATEFEIYKVKWMQELEHKLQAHRNRVLYLLRSKSIVAEGILLNPSREQSSDYKLEVQEAYNDYLRLRNFDSYPFTPIPAEAWNHENVSWNASSLKIGSRVYVLARFSKQNALQAMPIEASEKILESEKDRGLGRPKKYWDRVLSRALEITNGGASHIKQDALAQQLRDWYVESFGSDISLSAIKKKLKEYKENKILDVEKFKEL
ncbi:hypothetical protein [Litorimonas sp.]|uniref:hypothetical protein n=1 Tax=Litorimonas sp. TaxID=1892381 RepID=UPI003A8BAF53